MKYKSIDLLSIASCNYVFTIRLYRSCSSNWRYWFRYRGLGSGRVAFDVHRLGFIFEKYGGLGNY